MASVFPLANYRSFPLRLANGSDTTICTVPTGFWWRLTHVLISIGTGAAGTANLGWNQASSSTRFVINDAAPVASGAPAEWEGMPLALEAGDSIKVTAATNNDVIVTVIEEARTPGQKGPSGLPGLGSFGPGWGKATS